MDGMDSRLFRERFYQESKLRDRVRLSIILSMIFYPSFIILDAIVTPDWFQTFVTIRVIVVAFNALLLAAMRFAKTPRGLLNLGMGFLIIDALGISLMVQLMGGFMSAYYQGLTLVVMCMMVLLPFAFKESIITMTVVWLSYVVPSAILVDRATLDWRIVVNNLFFLTSIIMIGVFASMVMDNIRQRELSSRIRLEEMTEQLRESNAKLKTLDELKTQFFANINHELRTPLTLMLTPLGPILDGRMGKVSAGTKDVIETVRRNGYKLLKLINNLLDLTKLEEGKMRLKVRTVDLTEFVSGLLTTVQPLADRQEIKLFFQHPPHRIGVTLDPEQFEKVVLNLLSNALKFTAKKGRITVYLEDREADYLLTVEDTGIGIPESKLKSIFDRFSQVDGSSSRRHEGTGIGLSLAREIVLLHQGRIWAESEIGRGSRFHVEILKSEDHFVTDVLDRRQEDQPVMMHRRSSDVEEPRVQDIVTDFRRLQLVDLEKIEVGGTADLLRTHDSAVLVIDDNPEVLKLMRMILADEFDLDLTTSAEQGLEILREKSPDLVLCDAMMPGMDGYAFCRAVKSDPDLKHIPVILVTARSGAEMTAQGIDAGADDYIAKPFDSVQLKARVRALLRMRRVESELSLANRNLKMRTNDLVEQQRSLFLSMVKSLVSAIDAKDEHTRHHSSRVTEFTLLIARRMGFSAHELEDLELAALLHDVGKIAVPESILNKPARLSPDEFGFIKEHPLKGESILKPIVELHQIAKVVRAHHEHYNGTGYPDGLRGQEIPIGARIMAVADAYDSIVSDRPYRKASSHSYAVKEITRCSGSQFDPEVVQHFLEIAAEFAQFQTTKTEAPGSQNIS